jgi:hypothetical protein
MIRGAGIVLEKQPPIFVRQCTETVVQGSEQLLAASVIRAAGIGQWRFADGPDGDAAGIPKPFKKNVPANDVTVLSRRDADDGTLFRKPARDPRQRLVRELLGDAATLAGEVADKSPVHCDVCVAGAITAAEPLDEGGDGFPHGDGF